MGDVNEWITQLGSKQLWEIESENIVREKAHRTRWFICIGQN